MRGKSIFIFLISTSLIAFYLLIAPVNAQKTMSVEDFNTNYPSQKESYISDHVIVSGFIRDIKSESIYEREYYFTIDDGTGARFFVYFGGLGDIKEGDKVFVEINPSKSFNIRGKEIKSGYMIEGLRGPYWVVVSTVSKSSAKSYATTPTKPEEASAPKTPGFEIIIGAVAMFFARKIIGKLS